MLVPNTEYIIVKVEDKATLIPGKTFRGKVIVGSFCDIIDHNGNTFVISFKTEVYAIIKDEAEELDLFNQEMRADTLV